MTEFAKHFPAPDLFLRTDPLAGALSSAAARRFGQEFLLWAPLALLPLLLGRVFCGWICPLGTLLDLADQADRMVRSFADGRLRILRINKRESFRKFMTVKYHLLIVLITAALLGTSIFGYFDPLSLLTRAFAFSLQPLLAQSEFDLRGKAALFGFENGGLHFYRYALFSAFLLLVILLLNRFFRRAWCRTLCPLGAMNGVVGRYSLLKLSVDKGRCTGCLRCVEFCKMGAIDFPESRGPVYRYRKEECIVCYRCVDACPSNAITFGFSRRMANRSFYGFPSGHEDLRRRWVVRSLMAGAVLAPMAKLGPTTSREDSWAFIRPPFARETEAEFLDLCIRCGLCIRACRTNTLQPAGLEAGLEGIKTPVLKPHIGPCSAECTACGAVCPTNAIVRFTEQDKFAVRMGTARLELSRCIAYTENKDCNECVKVCPSLAIKVRMDGAGVFRPAAIVPAECNGCGACEKRCREIIVNGTACVTSGKGRGLPADFATIMKNRAIRKERGHSWLPPEEGS